MIRRSFTVLGAVACLATAAPPATAQEPMPQGPAREQSASTRPGPRLDPGFKSYRPKLAQEEQALVAAAAADRTTITISTIGLVLLIILLIVLIT